MAQKGNKNAAKFKPAKVAEAIDTYTKACYKNDIIPYQEKIQYEFESGMLDDKKIKFPKGTYLSDFARKHTIVSEALGRLKTVQKLMLLQTGLSGESNSTIVKLILSANHGMSETQNIDHTSQGDRISFGLDKVIDSINAPKDKA